MKQEYEICVRPEDVFSEKKILDAVKRATNNRAYSYYKILKRSIDARSREIVYRIKVEVGFDCQETVSTFVPQALNVKNNTIVHIIGAGPAGLFAALRCIELGLKPVIFERGKSVQERRVDVANLNKYGILNQNSNYCFGEGGAGTFSDGKLYTRSNKRGDVDKVLHTFVYHGASKDILIDARPHIGTNKLPEIIQSIRNFILNCGGEIHFNSKLRNIKLGFGKIESIQINDEWYSSRAVILATGHSARDVYEILHQQSILLESKPFALGLRIEHPQSIIDQSQYHCKTKPQNLPPAYYSLVHQVETRGVFSFCMCPGGIIAPCTTEDNAVVVNGWSPSKRNNAFANSGTVVQVQLKDVQNSNKNPLAMLEFQQSIEQKAFFLGGGRFKAPAQRMVDFVENKVSNSLPTNSYFPGTTSVNLREILPHFVFMALQKTLPVFGTKMKGYYTNEAILVGVESRTSSPIKIPRNKETLQHPQIEGLFPCAEGAGYAGGIVSAAVDGENCANAVWQLLG